MVKSLFHLYFRSSHHLYFIFLSRVKINSINWLAPNIWVFIAQLVEHCSANAETMGSNPVEALKFFSGLNLQLLKLRLQLRWSNLYFASNYVALASLLGSLKTTFPTVRLYTSTGTVHAFAGFAGRNYVSVVEAIDLDAQTAGD